jgi:hypothetical protein
MTNINTFDLDGVVIVDEKVVLRPNPEDIIITGRSVEEALVTLTFLRDNGVNNQVFFNPLLFSEKTRESSGIHKAKTMINLMRHQNSITLTYHFEDDSVQKAAIENHFTEYFADNPMIDRDYLKMKLPKVILIENPDTPKENVWNG